MATDQERLLLLLEANTRQFERSLDQAERTAERRFRAIERNAQVMNQKALRSFQDLQTKSAAIIAAIGVSGMGRDVVQLADTWTTVGNRIATAGVATERVAAVQQLVADIASRTRSDLDSTADLFARMYRSSEDLGASLTEVSAVTELVSKALAGASQQEREGAIRQLGQGLGSGRLQGDELRSILENSRPIAEAIAREFNTTVGNLRELGRQGVLESRRVFEAILRAGPEIEAAFSKTTFTVADSFTRLRTEAARFIGTNDQTAGSVRALTKLIDFVATNFESLADAIVIAATVLGGAFAGNAAGRALTALTEIRLKAATTGAALRAAFTFTNVLTVFAAAIAVVATQTDWLTSSTEALQRASDSTYTALQSIASLQEDLTALAEASGSAADETGSIAAAADDAREALQRMQGASEGLQGQLDTQGRITTALAQIEKDRTLNALRSAIADREAAAAAIERNAAMRGLAGAIGTVSSGRGTFSQGRQAFGITPEERAQVAELRRLNEEVFAPALAAGEGLDIETWQQILDAAGGTARATAQTSANQERATADLERQAELGLARLRHEYDRVAVLETAEAVEKRTAQYVSNGLSQTEAMARAVEEVRLEREAMNAEAQRGYELSQLQEDIELARIANNVALADVLSDQLEIQNRARQIGEQLRLSEEEALRRATEQVERRRAAINEQRRLSLQLRDLELEIEIARRRGDTIAVASLERRRELQQQIEELRRDGFSESAAVDRAEAEIEALERADLQGKFRDWFSGGIMAALDGDLSEFFENWLRERAAAGLERALDSVADILFDSFSDVLSSVMRSGQDGIGQAIAAVFSGSATAGLNELGEGSAKAGEALGSVLAAAAANAASNVVLTGTAAAASAAQETAASSAKRAVVNLEVNSMLKLTAAANSAAAALSRIAATGGASSSSSGLLGSILNGFLGGFGGGGASGALNGFLGGFRAGGGPMQAGMGYIVGERGRELVVPQVPSFAIPNHMLGGANVTYVDRTTISIQGASTKEVMQLRMQMESDLMSRRETTTAIIREAISRRALRG